MRILHSSDWHLGHTFQDQDREYEHRAFLTFLLEQLAAQEIDALLLAGDIFDHANPSAAAQDLWYWFLARAVQVRPGLQVVAIAGNHDSAARLQAPDHLLRQFQIRIVGNLPRKADRSFDPEGLVLPLCDAAGVPRATVIAMPFLRAGDLPPAEGEDPLIEGVRRLYQEAVAVARPAGLPILAMGHCYLVAGQLSELSERKVLGGNQHALPTALFPEDIAYVALGHLHLPQALDGGRIRYSGSPIPLSMPERHYRHSFTVLEIDAQGGLGPSRQVAIPRALAFLRIPEAGALALADLLERIRALEPVPEAPGRPRPYLEVAVALDAPDGSIRATLEAALEGKGYLLSGIRKVHAGTGQSLADAAPRARGLEELQEEDVFRLRWAKEFQDSEPSPAHLAAFHELLDQVLAEAGR